MFFKEHVQLYLQKQLEYIDFEFMLIKIFKKENFDPKYLHNLNLDRKFIQEVLLYLLLRENMLHFTDVQESSLLEKQFRIKNELNYRSFNNIHKIAEDSKIFIEKIVILSIVIITIASRLDLNILPPTDPNEVFIALLFLTSGKLVSIKSYELAKDRMRKKKKILDHMSTNTTIRSVRSTINFIKEGQNEELMTFMEELRKTLYAEKPQRVKKFNKSKYFRRKKSIVLGRTHAGHKKENTVSFHEQMPERSHKSQDRAIVVNIARAHKTPSLDRNFDNDHVKESTSKSLKSRTQIVKFRKMSRDTCTNNQSEMRKMSVMTPKIPQASLHLRL